MEGTLSQDGTLANRDGDVKREQGLVSVLKQLHADLDRTVAAAYGGPAELDGEALLERLVALNKQRAAEEAQGQIRYLRPDYQNPATAQPVQTQLDIGTGQPEASAHPALRFGEPKKSS